MSYYERMAAKIPTVLRNKIISDSVIDQTGGVANKNKAMALLYDIFEEYLDPRGEFDDFDCSKCRNYILDAFQRMKPYLHAG